MIKVVHCADLHLDSSFSSMPTHIGNIRREETKESFGRIITLAKEEAADILIISGDFFDRERVKPETMEFVLKKFSEIPHIPIFICAGNHDYLNRNYYYNQMKWPEHVHVFSGLPSHVDFPEKNMTVYGVSFAEQQVEKSMLQDFKVENPERINILTIHGIVNGTGNWNPMTSEELQQTQMDYVALGHVHTFSGINKVGKTYWAYPGTHEGKGFDETGPKGIIIGELDKGICQMDFIETWKRQYILLEVDITGLNTYEDIQEKILKENILEDRNHLYKIILTGYRDEGFNLNIHLLKNKLDQALFYFKIVDQTKISIDLEALREEDTLKNVFINQLIDQINLNQDEKSNRALELALMALNGDVIDDDAD